MKVKLIKMSINTANMAKACYQDGGFDWEQPLAKAASKLLFAQNLRRLLGVKRGQASELARTVGVDPSMVAAWKAGRNAPEVEKLGAIADFFDVPVAELFRDPSDRRSPQSITLRTAYDMIGEAIKDKI